jgi:hypothetical protein
MPEQQLNGTEVLGSPVGQKRTATSACLGSVQQAPQDEPHARAVDLGHQVER